MTFSEEFKQKTRERMKQNNPMKQPEVVEKVKKTKKEMREKGLFKKPFFSQDFRERASQRMKANNPMKRREIAQKTANTLKKKYALGFHKIKSHNPNLLWTKEQTDFLIQNYATNRYKEIAKILNKSYNAINCKRKKLKLPIIKGKNKGTKSVWWGRKHTEETKIKMSEAQRGEKSHNYGKKLSEEIRIKMRLANLGKKRSEQSKTRYSQSKMGSKNPIFGKFGSQHPLFGRHHSEETKQKIREKNIGKASPIRAGKGKKFVVETPFQGQKILRSSYEKAFYDYLMRTNTPFYYEKKRFPIIIEGNIRTTYAPDFYLPNTNEWVEIKGWFFKKAQEKVKAMEEQHNISIKIIRLEDLQKLEEQPITLIIRRILDSHKKGEYQ
jgi:hypothetical protein